MMTVLMKQYSLDADDEYKGVALVILSFFCDGRGCVCH